MEFEKFMNTLENKSENTKKVYSRQYHKLQKFLNANIADTPNSSIIDACELVENSNSRAQVLNIGILIKKMESQDYAELEKFRDTTKQNIQAHLESKNNLLANTLPEVNDILNYTQQLFNTKQYRKYVINYLLCNFFVRNEDLDLEIINKKSELNDKDNFLLIQQRPARVVFIKIGRAHV